MILKEVIKLRNRGLSVFPVSNENKVPLVKWKRLQDNLPSYNDVQKWFSVNNRSVGIATGPVSGVLLIDFDFSKHPEARQFYETHTWPKTWKETTKSGGLHLYFKWVAALNNIQTNTTSKLSPGVDTKGHGGYSKISPSLGYQWIESPDKTVLAEPPLWLFDLLPNKISNLQTANKDPLSNEQSKLQELLNGIKPGNRNDSFTRVAGTLRARGFTSGDIFDLLKSKATEVEFSLEELRILTESIGRYRPGTLGRESEGFSSVSRQVEIAEEGKASSIEEFLKDQEKVDWIVPGVVAANSIGFIAGLPETMKTFIMLDFAVEVSRGGKWLQKFETKKSKVLYVDQERFKGETQRRLKALILGKGLDPKEINEYLFVRCGSTTRLNLQPSFDAFKKILSDIKPQVVVIDSLATIHTAEENNRQSIQEVLEKVKQLRAEFNCSFLFLSHENKMAFNKEESGDPSISQMAGSIAIPAAAECVLTVRRQDSESSMVYQTKNTLAPSIAPFLVKVQDLIEDRSKISVIGY